MSKYSNEFKFEVVKYCVDQYHGYTDVAKYFNIPNRGFNINHKNSYKTYERTWSTMFC